VDTIALLKNIAVGTFALLMLLATMVGALAVPTQVELTPSTLDLILNVNETRYVPLTIRNPSNDMIFNLRFSNVSAYFEPPAAYPSLAPNSSVSLSLKFSSRDEISLFTMVSILSFDYLLDVEQTPKTYVIGVNDSGFAFNNLTILDGDSVRFRNNGTTWHTVTEINLTPGIEDHNLSVNSEWTLDQPTRPYYFFDRNLGVTFNLYVAPRNPDSLVHSASLDSSLPIQLRAIPHPVILDVDLLTRTHTLRYNEVMQGAIRVYNPDNVTAYGVNFSAAWTQFYEHDIDIPSKTSRVFTYNLTPANISRTNETNRTYLLPLSASGFNVGGINGMNLSIEAFIPWDNLTGIIRGDGFIIQQTVLDAEGSLAFCLAQPDNALCKEIREQFTVEKEVIRTMKENATVSGETLELFMRELEGLRFNVDSAVNFQQDTNEYMQNDAQWKKDMAAIVKQLVDQRQADIQEIQDDSRFWRNFWIVLAIVVVLLIIVGIVILYSRVEDEDKPIEEIHGPIGDDFE